MMGWLTDGTLEPHWWWLILALLMGIGEIFLPGVFLIWIALAAAVTGLVSMGLGLSVPLQLVLFAVLCLVITYAGRKWYKDNPVESQDPMLNDRSARLVGKTVTVVEAIRHGSGRVKVGDGVWNATGPDADEGATLRVTGVQDGALIVEP